MASRATIGARAAIAGAMLSCLAGCGSFPWRKIPLDVASGLYDRAALTYRLDAGKLGQPLDAVRVEGQRVSYEQVASSPLPDESIGTLSIEYPHPSGRSGYALARFVLDSAQSDPDDARVGWNPFRKKSDEPQTSPSITGTQPEVHETWELDIEHAELDAIFKMLTNLGFYHSQQAGPARLTVRLNDVAQSKDWEQIPALNQLVQRVRSRGQLVAYARPGAAAGPPRDTIVSTAAYRKLLVARGLEIAHPARVASAFSLPLDQPPAAVAAGPPPPGNPQTPFAGGLAGRVAPERSER